MSDLARVLREFAGLVESPEPWAGLPERLCAASVELLGCDGAAITLGYAEDERLTLAVTDVVAEAIDDAQDVVQEGPGPDAYLRSDYRTMVLDEESGSDPRWPILATEDLAGVLGGRRVVVHAVPMSRGGTTVGVLTLWAGVRRPPLDPALAHLVAAVIAAVLAEEVAQSDDVGLVESWAGRSEVHQASGFVSARTGLSPHDALSLLRAHSYGSGETMRRTARDVLEGRVPLPDRRSGSGAP